MKKIIYMLTIILVLSGCAQKRYHLGTSGVITPDNPRHFLIGDLTEGFIDKFGNEGVVGPAAKDLGKKLSETKEDTTPIRAYGQGTLILKKALEDMVANYVKEHPNEENPEKFALADLKAESITFVGPAANYATVEKYIVDHGYKGKVILKNDKGDIVGSVIGLNPSTVKNSGKLSLSNPMGPHTGYTVKDTKIDSHESVFQKVVAGLVFGLKLLDKPKDLIFGKKKEKKEEKK